MHEKGLESLRKDEVVHSNSGGLYGYHTHHVKKKTHTLILICYATSYDFALYNFVFIAFTFLYLII
ncbi:unnamed protein product [Brassica napus]|uniref:(rape) hypothetical protein n=1 Tax=Brassica napus TaxID=3708 RepID=A0A816MKZ5_BRANA|nr:unnamed protein product [Brassica napus]